jgi:serine/threonine protein kinase
MKDEGGENKVDNEWGKEARALNDINTLGHGNIIRCLAAIRRGDSRYFLFPWANGQSLCDFWRKTPEQIPSADLITASIKQIHGLADALYCLHNFERSPSTQPNGVSSIMTVPRLDIDGQTLTETDESGADNIRHGDLKPDNILRFLENGKGADSSRDVGTLKMADMGLAKHHLILTQDRSVATQTIVSITKSPVNFPAQPSHTVAYLDIVVWYCPL